MKSTVKVNKLITKMIAHRGLSGIERENTNPAFIAAGNRSYYGIETDVHVTADGKFIICHDNDLKRIANIDGKNIYAFISSYKTTNHLMFSTHQVIYFYYPKSIP